jgi:small subunit ribosomal protein S17
VAELRAHEARRRTKVGTVVGNKMHKTVVVAVESVRRHRLYGKNVRNTRRYKAHDEANACQVGDQVIIAESRPISKDKHWVVRQTVRETIGPGLEVLEEEAAVAEQRAPAAETAAPEATAAETTEEDQE